MCSVVTARRLNCSLACGILTPQKRTEPESPALWSRSLTTGPPGKSKKSFLIRVHHSSLGIEPSNPFFWKPLDSAPIRNGPFCSWVGFSVCLLPMLGHKSGSSRTMLFCLLRESSWHCLKLSNDLKCDITAVCWNWTLAPGLILFWESHLLWTLGIINNFILQLSTSRIHYVFLKTVLAH